MKLLRDERGSSIVIMAIAITVILGIIATITDIGLLYLEKAKISNALDASVLAAVQELPMDKVKAIEMAKKYGEINGLLKDKMKITVAEDNRAIRASYEKNVPLYFAKIFGIDEGVVASSSNALVGIVGSVNGSIRPFAIEDSVFEFGKLYTLKDGAGGGYVGNYGALDIGGSGASNFTKNIKYGYSGTLKVGDHLNTEPGNMAGPVKVSVDDLIRGCNHVPVCTYESFQRDCSRIIILPIIDSLDVYGRGDVTIVGFASFFLEDVEDNQSTGHLEIQGRFLETIGDGEIYRSGKDFGLRSVKLTE